MVKPEDFFFGGFYLPGNTTNAVQSTVTPVGVTQMPTLNTLGISLARLDFAPSGINPPHAHPCASEILLVLQGSLQAGFVTSNVGTANNLFTKVLQTGGFFVFPVGLIHFQKNVGNGHVVAIATLSSQNPGVITIVNAAFGSTQDMLSYILSKVFQVDVNVVNYLQTVF